MSIEPCMGHDCDMCPACAKGRCCRRDNPGYELPAEGSWQPVYGEVGVRNSDGTRMECHACGQWFVNIGTHTWQAHDLSAREYKAAFGLSNRGLVGEEYRGAMSAKMERLVAEGRVVPPPPSVTPEQHAAARRPRETKNLRSRIARDRLIPAGHAAEAVERMRATKARQSAEAVVDMTCVVCGATFRRLPHRSRDTCGRPGCSAEWQSRRAADREAAKPAEVKAERGRRMAARAWSPERRGATLAARLPASEARKRRISKACEECGAMFETIPSHEASAFTCSPSCRVARIKRLGIQKGKTHSPETRALLSEQRREWWARRRSAVTMSPVTASRDDAE